MGLTDFYYKKSYAEAKPEMINNASVGNLTYI
jgi:hypothetical protein